MDRKCTGSYYRRKLNTSIIIKELSKFMPDVLINIIVEYCKPCKYCGNKCNDDLHIPCNRDFTRKFVYKNMNIYLCDGCIERHLHFYPKCENKECTPQIKCERCTYMKYGGYSQYEGIY